MGMVKAVLPAREITGLFGQQFSVPIDVIYAEKVEFENPTIMEDKQCKQTERFSVMTEGRDYFLS